MFTTFKKIWVLLTLEGHKRLYWLMLAVVVLSLLDTFGVASIFPFLNVLSDPEIIQKNDKLKWAYDYFHFRDKDSFLISLGGIAFIFLMVNNILRAFISISLIRYSQDKRCIISKVLGAKYLYEPYSFFLNRNTSELTTYFVSEVARVVSGVLIPCLQIFSRSLMALLIISLLIVVDPYIAFLMIAVLGSGYVIIFGFVKRILTHVGIGITESSKSIYKSLAEAFGGIKDIKLLGKELIFIERFSNAVKRISKCFCWQYIIFQFPRYAFEVVVFGGILFIALFIAVAQNNYQSVIPIVGLYAFAAYRLMPTLQQIYTDLTSIQSSLPALEAVYRSEE